MLGDALRAQRRPDPAPELYRRARLDCTGDFNLESAELFALCGSERISDTDLFARHATFGRRIEKACAPRTQPFRNVKNPRRRLRVGYLSGDFRHHVVTLFMLPVLERHDRSAYEAYCYSSTDMVDSYTRQISARADVWRPVAGLSPTQLAEAIGGGRIRIPSRPT